MAAPDGTRTFTAKLDIKTFAEMKNDAKKWVTTQKDVKPIFAKNIVFKEKVNLNPKKWNESKLSKMMEAWVRYDMKILAVRVRDLMKKADGASPKEFGKILKGLEAAVQSARQDIAEKCTEGLDALESGKAEAAAGIALGKKAMSKAAALQSKGVIKLPVEMGKNSLKAIISANDSNLDPKKYANLVDRVSKKVGDAQKELGNTGKDVQNIAKFLTQQGKKMESNENGQIAAFGKKVSDKKLQSTLDDLDKAIDALEDTLTDYSTELKKGTVENAAAKGLVKNFEKLAPKQKVADDAVKEMRNLAGDFKKIEKDLK